MQNSHVGHVDFMLFVSISCALGSQREPSIHCNTGFRELLEKKKIEHTNNALITNQIVLILHSSRA